MKLEDMKKNIPDTPEFIHEMIRSEVEHQLNSKEVVPMRSRKKWTGVKAAAAAVVCVLATSTVVYAGVKVYHMHVEKEGNYQVATGIQAGDDEILAIPKQIADIDITAEYIPEGMEWADKTHLQYADQNGFFFTDVLLDQGDLNQVKQDQGVVDYEEGVYGQYEGVYLKYHELETDGSFNQRVYLLCPDINRVIMIYASDYVSKEDVVKVAENLVITENDTLLETASMYTWSDVASPEVIPRQTITVVDGKELSLYQVGDAFDMIVSTESNDGGGVQENQVSVCVDSVQVADDLQLLDPDLVPEEWNHAVGTDGKLKENTLSYIRSGDGIESLDEVVKTENVAQKLVYVTVTYTNHSENELDHMLYMGNMVLLDCQDGRYQIYDPEKQAGDGYDRISWDGVARMAEMEYYSCVDEDGKNYISSLKPGESIQVNMAWVVNENDLNHMYLCLDGKGSSYGFTESMLKTGLVDIRVR